jgi:nucleoside-diphosphate-sugar epimerase
MSEEALGETINLATEVETDIKTLAQKINKKVGNKAGIEYEPRREWDTTARRQGSINKARRLIQYEPTTNLDQGLERTIEWFETNWEEIQRTVQMNHSERV